MAAQKKLMSQKAVVGLFLIVTLAILAWGTMQLGGLGFQREEGYPLLAMFDSAYGIDPGSSVLIAGIKIGEVTSIDLVRKRARITMKILKGVQLYEDASITVKTSGILGEKYLDVNPGTEDLPILQPGAYIEHTSAPPDFEVLAQKFSEISVDIKEITAGLSYALGSLEARESLRNVVLSMEEMTGTMNAILRENRQDAREMIASLNRMTEMFEREAPGLIAGVNRLTDDASELVGSTNEAVTDLRPRVQETLDDVNGVVARLDAAAGDLQDITARVNRGEGTIGRLLNDPETADRLNSALAGVNQVLRQVAELRTIVQYRGEYRFNESNADRLLPRDRPGGLKNYVGLRIQPREDKFYLFEIISDPRGRIEDSRTVIRDPATGQVVQDTQTRRFEDQIKFSAQIAKKYYGVTLRGGMIQNSGGVGLDYAIIDPDLQISMHAYDFNRPENNVNLKAELNYLLLNHFFLTVGAEDLINRQGEPLYFAGGGLMFDDDDLKLLLATLPSF